MQGEPKPRRVIIYQDEASTEPFSQWLQNLKDPMGRRIILRRLRQLESGHFGDSKALDDGLYELRIHSGPGYRVYYGQGSSSLVIILSAGTKSAQTREIDRAQAYWKEYRAHEKEL